MSNIAVPGMAYFAGSGPQSTTCEQCEHFILPDRKRGECSKFKALAGVRGERIREDMPSCKHFAISDRAAARLRANWSHIHDRLVDEGVIRGSGVWPRSS